MKKYGILVMTFAFCFSLAVMAQDQLPPQHRGQHQKEFKHAKKTQLSAQKRAGYLAVDLELTDAQRAKVQALFEKQDKVNVERQAEVKKMREQEMAKMVAERKANEAEMEKILGTEKFKQFKDKQVERIQKIKKMKGNQFGKPYGPTPQRKHMPRPDNRMPEQQPVQK
jgi:hypothetical protein